MKYKNQFSLKLKKISLFSPVTNVLGGQFSPKWYPIVFLLCLSLLGPPMSTLFDWHFSLFLMLLSSHRYLLWYSLCYPQILSEGVPLLVLPPISLAEFLRCNSNLLGRHFVFRSLISRFINFYPSFVKFWGELPPYCIWSYEFFYPFNILLGKVAGSTSMGDPSVILSYVKLLYMISMCL